MYSWNFSVFDFVRRIQEYIRKNRGVTSMAGTIFMIIIILLIVYIVTSCVRIVPQAQAYVIERLGAYNGTWSVGMHFKVPFIDRVAKKVLLKEQVVDFAPQPVITRIM